MKAREIAKILLPPIVFDTIRSVRKKKVNKPLQQYLINGKIPIPWSSGYDLYQTKLIIQALSDEILLERFRCNESLPPDYGVGVDERCIEYPWVMARLHDELELLLDAGSTFNYEFILNQPVLRRKVIHILTLAPESTCFWQRGISYLFHDLRDIPIRDAYYDTIVCISTLEHVGCDNTIFTHNKAHREHRPEDFTLAMQELRRVLKPGGTLFLTVPFGIYRHFVMFQQFDRNLLSHAIKAFGKANETEEAFYRYTAQGWQLSNELDCGESKFVEWIAQKWATCQKLDSLPVEPDLAAAARSVACVRLVKG